MLNRKTIYLLMITGLFFATGIITPLEANGSPKEKYFKADRAYAKLLKNKRKQKYRENWITCIKKYQAVYQDDPDGPWAAAGMYKTGILYYELYKRSYVAADRQEAIDTFERVVKRYPKSRYRLRSEKQITKISGKSAPKTPVKKPSEKKSAIKHKTSSLEKPDPPQKAPEKTPVVRSSGPAIVDNLRFWSNPSYTRVVIDVTNETTFQDRLLKKDPKIHKPQRLYVDLDNSRLGEKIDPFIPIDDPLLKNARAGQYDASTVRVVVDIKSFKNYKIFSLKNPFRIVIDVWGEDAPAHAAPAHAAKADHQHKMPASAIAKQLALGVQKIVIDPGHGGRDYGAPGYLKGVHEKKVVLQLAKKLKRKLHAELGCEVIMTRTNDTFLTLEERTAIANTQNADLFISLHTNASRDRRAYGMETYFLNLATDDEAIRVAAKENATSTKNISDLQSILLDLMQNAKINESSRLATHVQDAMYSHMRKHFNRTKNKGVKQAPFYVLLGAQMPAILVETAFISNPRECKRLINARYQDLLCDAIVRGVKNYIRETNPTAFVDKLPPMNSKG